MKLLLTGPPRAGKSLLVRRLAEEYPGTAGGMLVAEICGADRRRCGFEVQVVWCGPGRPLQVVERAVFAHVERDFPWRAGRYRVDPAALQLAVRALDGAMHEGGLLIIDEIGPLQILSAEFRDAVLRCLDSSGHMLGTISQAADPFLDAVRSRPGVRLMEVTRVNRNHLVEGLKRWMSTV